MQKQKLNLLSIIFIADNNTDIFLEKIKNISKKLLKNKRYEFLIIDNGLNQKEKQKVYSLKNKISNIRIITLTKKYDYDTALIAALDNCIGDGVLVLNYLNDDEKTAKKIINYLHAGYDIVNIENKDDFNKIKLLLRIFIKFTNVFSSHQIFNNLTGTLGLSRKAVNSITQIRRKNRNFLYLQDYLGLKVINIKTKLSKSFLNEFNKNKFLNFFIDGIDIVVSNSVKPLRLVSFFSAFASFLSLIFIIYVFLVTLIKKNIIEGWISTTLVMGTMFFMLFLILTILSEYILRILEEVRNEPLYFIEKEIDQSIYLSNNELNITEENY